MTSDCPWRRLEADGTVDACWGEGFEHPEPEPDCDNPGHGPCWDHTSECGAWDESDPCAWEHGDGSMLDLAHDLMEQDDIVKWLHTPNEGLDGKRPLDAPDEAAALLHAIADGAYL